MVSALNLTLRVEVSASCDAHGQHRRVQAIERGQRYYRGHKKNLEFRIKSYVAFLPRSGMVWLMEGSREIPSSKRTEWFATTHWSVVLTARDGDTTQADAAIEKLCRAYWQPLYAYVRREGYGVEDAQDLTQEFFGRFLEKDWLGHLQHQQGKFRSFLLTFLKHFLSDQRDLARAQKRGGRYSFISLDQFAAEERDRVEPADRLTADQIYERRWAQALLARVAERLREEHRADGRLEVYETLVALPHGKRAEGGYADIAVR